MNNWCVFLFVMGIVILVNGKQFILDTNEDLDPNFVEVNCDYNDSGKHHCQNDTDTWIIKPQLGIPQPQPQGFWAPCPHCNFKFIGTNRRSIKFTVDAFHHGKAYFEVKTNDVDEKYRSHTPDVWLHHHVLLYGIDNDEILFEATKISLPSVTEFVVFDKITWFYEDLDPSTTSTTSSSSSSATDLSDPTSTDGTTTTKDATTATEDGTTTTKDATTATEDGTTTTKDATTATEDGTTTTEEDATTTTEDATTATEDLSSDTPYSNSPKTTKLSTVPASSTSPRPSTATTPTTHFTQSTESSVPSTSGSPNPSAGSSEGFWSFSNAGFLVLFVVVITLLIVAAFVGGLIYVYLRKKNTKQDSFVTTNIVPTSRPNYQSMPNTREEVYSRAPFPSNKYGYGSGPQYFPRMERIKDV